MAVARRLLDRPRLEAWSGVALALVVASLAVWRVAFIVVGVDLDTDAYGHHAIARRIVDDPRDLGLHWVWLPLFHYAQAIFVALFDLRLDGVRIANSAITAATPMILYALLRRQSRRAAPSGDATFGLATAFDPVPLLAALLVALSPIAMQMGTTGQPEPIFALLVLLTVSLLDARRFVAAALILSLAALVRYEAWAIPPALVASRLADRLFSRSGAPRARGLRWLWPVLLPALVVFAWAAARRPVDGAWFWFLNGTRAFANDAQAARGSLHRGLPQLLADARYYPVDIAHICMGASLWLVPFGLLRVLRRAGTVFLFPYLAILGFLSAVWIARGSLGLTRHFAVMVPAYATIAAHGAAAMVAAVVAGIERALPRWRRSARARALSIAAFLGVACWVAVDASRTLDDWMADWRDKSWQMWPDRRAVASFLRATPEGERIFCDEPTIEVWSELDRHRFDRGFLGDDEATRRRIDQAAIARGEVWVVTWSTRLEAMQRAYGVAFAAPVPKGTPTLVVVRVDRAKATGAAATR